MKILEITQLDQGYTLYLDLDGVMVDFEKFAISLTGVTPLEWEQNKKLKGKFWGKVNKLVKEGKPVFGAMDPMSDAFVLWDYVNKYDPIILSATGHVSTAAHEKREWVREHLDGRAADKAIFVMAATDKAQYATPTSVLIDDRKKAIEPWIEAGGIGILHVSAEDTIRQLKELGL